MAFSWHLRTSSVIGEPAAMRASVPSSKTLLHCAQSVTFWMSCDALGSAQLAACCPPSVQQALVRLAGLADATFLAMGWLDVSALSLVSQASMPSAAWTAARLNGPPAVVVLGP